MKPWKTIAQKTILSDRWLTLKAVTYKLWNGIEISPYYVITEKEWVHVVAIDNVGLVVTVQQYRPAADVVCVELPAGVVEDGEDIESAARRELREETGLMAADLTFVASLWANPARQTNRIHIFIAEDLTNVGEQRLDISENILCGRASFGELYDSALAGKFSQSLHLASLAMAERFLAARKLYP